MNGFTNFKSASDNVLLWADGLWCYGYERDDYGWVSDDYVELPAMYGEVVSLNSYWVFLRDWSEEIVDWEVVTVGKYETQEEAQDVALRLATKREIPLKR